MSKNQIKGQLNTHNEFAQRINLLSKKTFRQIKLK